MLRTGRHPHIIKDRNAFLLSCPRKALGICSTGNNVHICSLVNRHWAQWKVVTGNTVVMALDGLSLSQAGVVLWLYLGSYPFLNCTVDDFVYATWSQWTIWKAPSRMSFLFHESFCRGGATQVDPGASRKTSKAGREWKNLFQDQQMLIVVPSTRWWLFCEVLVVPGAGSTCWTVPGAGGTSTSQTSHHTRRWIFERKFHASAVGLDEWYNVMIFTE